MAKILPNLRQKIYLTVAFISLSLLLYSIWQIRPVIVEVDDFLGLASHFPPCYWVGLALLILDAVFAFQDRELKKDGVFILILIILGLFLYAPAVFGYAEARDPDAYYPSGEVRTLLMTHHFDMRHSHISTYYSWPLSHLLSASILTMTGIGLDSILKYFPLFWMLLILLVTYSIGKRLELAPNRCFLLSFLALSSVIFMSDYHNHSLGILLYLLLFMLLLNPRRTVADSVVVIPVFSALVITHGLDSLAVFPALILLSIYRREIRFITLVAVIFGAWYMYQAVPDAMEQGVEMLLTPMRAIFHAAMEGGYDLPSAPARLVTRYTQLTYAVSYIVLAMVSIILILRGRITGQPRKWVISSFCWAIGAGLLVFAGYGIELLRTYLFGIIPLVCIVVLSFSSRRLTTTLVIPLMFLLPIIFTPAHYGCDAIWGQVLTTELTGTKFFVLKVKPGLHLEDTTFYNFSCGYKLMIYYDSYMLYPHRWEPAELASRPEVDEDTVLDNSRYVVIGKMGTNAELFSRGKDCYGAWTQTEVAKKARLIYNNGDLKIYDNHLAKPVLIYYP